MSGLATFVPGRRQHYTLIYVVDDAFFTHRKMGLLQSNKLIYYFTKFKCKYGILTNKAIQFRKENYMTSCALQ